MALLTPQEAKEVFRLQKPEGRELLRRLLHWEDFDELRDLRRGILLDTLYESIVFAGGKGFPWVGVAQVAKFTEELLQETKGCPLTEAVTILADKLRGHQAQFSPTHLLALGDYLHNTFLCHYKLYQYVLGQDREADLTVTHLEVCPPPQPLPLAEGTDRSLWKHQQQVAALSRAEEQKRADVLRLREALRLGREQALPTVLEAGPPQERRVLRAEELESLVNEAIRVHIAGLKETLQQEIEVTFDILDLKLQKKILHLNPPAPFPPVVPSQPGPDENIKPNKEKKATKGKKAKK